MHSVTGAHDADGARDVVTLGPVRPPHAPPQARRGVRRRLAVATIGTVTVPLGLLVGLPGATQTDDPGAAHTSLWRAPGPHGALGPLAGRWRSAPIADGDVRRALEEAGLGRWGPAVLARLPERPLVAVLTVGRARVTLQLLGPDGHSDQVDWQRGNIVADRLRLSMTRSHVATSLHWRTEPRESDGTTTRVLRLDLGTSTESAAQGVPGAVWQRVLYTSEEFFGDRPAPGSQTQ